MGVANKVKKILYNHAGEDVNDESKALEMAVDYTKDVAKSLLSNGVTVQDVKRVLTTWGIFVVAVTVGGTAAYQAMTLFAILDIYKLAVHGFTIFLITLTGYLAIERNKLAVFGKITTLSTVSNDRIYALIKASSEALADGRLTPEEVAKIIHAVVSTKKNPE